MGSIKFTGNLMMAGLFAFSILSLAVIFSVTQDVQVKIGDDTQIRGLNESIQSNITAFRYNSDKVSDSYFSSQAQSGDEVSTSGSQFKVGIGTVTDMAKDTADVGFKSVFGQDNTFSIFFTAFIAFLVFVGVMYGYKAWFGRNPD